MLKLDQRPSGIWRIRGTHYGVRVDRSAKTRSRTEARAILKLEETRIFAAVHGVEMDGNITDSDGPTFGDAAASWLKSGGNSTIYFYFETVLIALGSTELSAITNGFLRQEATRLFPTQKHSTVNRGFFALVSAILTHASEERMMTPFKVRSLKTDRASYEWYEPERVDRLLDVAGDMRPFLTFMIGSGARPSEAVELTWSQIGKDNKRIILWKTKGGRVRSYDLCARTRAAMPPRRGDDDVVFHNGNGGPYIKSPDGRFYGPKRRLDRLTARTAQPKTSLRAMRHTWATWRYSLYPDIYQLQQDGGWSTAKMVENYTHVASRDIKKRVKQHGWFKK